MRDPDPLPCTPHSCPRFIASLAPTAFTRSRSLSKLIAFLKAPGDEDDVESEEEDEDEETIEHKKPVVSPVTSASSPSLPPLRLPTTRLRTSDVLALLRDYQISDVDMDYRESFYMCEAGPRLLQLADGPTCRCLQSHHSCPRPLHLYQGLAQRSGDDVPLPRRRWGQ